MFIRTYIFFCRSDIVTSFSSIINNYLEREITLQFYYYGTLLCRTFSNQKKKKKNKIFFNFGIYSVIYRQVLFDCFRFLQLTFYETGQAKNRALYKFTQDFPRKADLCRYFCLSRHILRVCIYLSIKQEKYSNKKSV